MSEVQKQVSRLTEDEELKLRKLQLLEERVKLSETLPHLYGFGWYDFAWKFFSSQDKTNLLTAANQISKSTTMQRKLIEWSTNREMWSLLWTTRPRQFWYLYPSRDVATVEFRTKFIDVLPKPEGEYDENVLLEKGFEHPVYGWKPRYIQYNIKELQFTSGVTTHFKTYAQELINLQSGTVAAMFCDEELPEELLSELMARLFDTDGYFHMGCTPTLGQEIWRRAFEEKGDLETYRDALKQQISLYDCQHYIKTPYTEAGKSKWTDARIDAVKARCKSETEIQRRVYGKFVSEEGLKYPQFSPKENIKARHPIPKSWFIFVGVDIGGGGDAHPPAIMFVGVSPDYKKGRVFLGWRGDDGADYTAGDVLKKYRLMKGSLNITGAYYDSACKDFGTLAARVGEPFQPAIKDNKVGEHTLGLLLQSRMLCVYDKTELQCLVVEFKNLRHNTPKTRARDDAIDATRFAVVPVPWDWTVLEEPQAKEEETPEEIEVRLAKRKLRPGEEWDLEKNMKNFISEDIDEWNQLYEEA